jgi:hypothetical protein
MTASMKERLADAWWLWVPLAASVGTSSKGNTSNSLIIHTHVQPFVTSAMRTIMVMSECPKCGEVATPLPSGKYRTGDLIAFEFDNEESRGYFCSKCNLLFGSPVASRRPAGSL